MVVHSHAVDLNLKGRTVEHPGPLDPVLSCRQVTLAIVTSYLDVASIFTHA